MHIPHSAEELIKKLDKEFPAKNPTITMSDRDIWFEAGKRDLINDLVFSLRLQQEREQHDNVLEFHEDNE